MKYSKFGLANTKEMLAAAKAGKYAVPAFNFYNMESLQAIMTAATATRSPVILAVSESALKYMGGSMLIGMVETIRKKEKGIKENSFIPSAFCLHLDHGHSFESCQAAIDLGFSSVMIDGSALPFDENIALTRRVVQYARKRGVSVEAELGALSGFEDEDTNSKSGFYTNPEQAAEFVRAAECDSLAIAIGTSHGAYKRQNSAEQLRFDILKKIAKLLPETPLVLHGASTIPQELVAEINANRGDLRGTGGIPAEQIRLAIRGGITKVNIDSDARLAWVAAVRSGLSAERSDFDPRRFLTLAREKMTTLYIDEIKKIMGSENKISDLIQKS